MAGDEGAEAAGGAGDQDGALGVDRPRDAEHDLADVPALAQVAEGLGGALRMSQAGDRRVAQGAPLEEPGDLGEHLPDALGAGFDQVEGAVGDARVRGGHLLGVADVGLAHLQEAPAARQQLQRGVDELAGQGVEDDVDALAAGGREELAP